MRCAISVACAVLLVACAESQQPPTQPKRPSLIAHTVITRTDSQHYKVSFDVRVGLIDGRLPTEAELGAVSRYLHGKERKKYDQTFVSFYLPGMVPGSGSFASAHHKPTMKVRINRFQIPDEYRLLLPDDS